MKQFDKELTKEVLLEVFDEFFDKSEQHCAFRFYSGLIGVTDEEVCNRVVEDYYLNLIQLGYDVNSVDNKVFKETLSEINRHILKLMKEWKVSEKLKEISKDFE